MSPIVAVAGLLSSTVGEEVANDENTDGADGTGRDGTERVLKIGLKTRCNKLGDGGTEDGAANG
jgi:hypothetical protein